MANEQTSVPLYAASEILTAANMNISAGTGVPVFATTVTRDAAFGGANEKVLAEGQLCYLSSTNVVQYYDGAAWATVGPAAGSGLTLISATTIGTTVTSTAITSAFSATYDVYNIVVSGGIASGDIELNIQLGATTTGYARFLGYGNYAAAVINGFGATGEASFRNCGQGSANSLQLSAQVNNPFAAKRTHLTAETARSSTSGDGTIFRGFLNDATSYTGFTLAANSGTMTGGTIRVYGLANS